MKFPYLLLAGLLVPGSILHAEEPARATSGGSTLVNGRYLATLRSEAVSRHPSTRSAALLAAAAERDSRGVRLWEDPSVGLAIMAASNDMRRDEGDVRVSFEQPLPKPGLFAANLSKADAIRRASGENSRQISLETGAGVARDAIELALADETIALQGQQIEWLGSMAENALQLSLSPDASGVDSIRLQGELLRERQILEAARRTRQSLSQDLNLKLGRPLDSPWPTLRLPAEPLPVPVAASEIARIPLVNPRVRAMREMANATAAETAVARADRKPQLTIGVDADLYSGGDVRSASVGLKMSLPFFNRGSYDAKIQAADLRGKAAEKDVEAARLETASAILATTTEIANAAAQARAYGGEISDRSLLAAKAIEGAWISSKSPLTDLLESRRIHFSICIEQRRFIAMQQVALEELNVLLPSRP